VRVGNILEILESQVKDQEGKNPEEFKGRRVSKSPNGQKISEGLTQECLA
jgi:hypothetical protein